MRPQILLFITLSLLLTLVRAWTKEDYEIFRLRDEIEAAEGADVTFYDFLGVKPSASFEEIEKAFRRRSRSLHPDKVKHSFIASRSTGVPRKPGEKRKAGVHVSKGPSPREIQRFVKQANERYGRLGVVANILKGQNRERYDYFLKHGFPKWRGTGYYYTRFRPGLGTVLIGLFIVGGGVAHYAALVVSWKRQRDFVTRYIRQARKAAWGDETGIRGISGLNVSSTTSSFSPVTLAEEGPDPQANLNRRQKRELEKQQRREARSGGKSGKESQSTTTTMASQQATTVTPTGDRKRVVAENGKILVVDSVGNVFLEEEDEDGKVEEFLLDPDEVPRPTVHDTALVRLPAWVLRKIRGLVADRFLKEGGGPRTPGRRTELAKRKPGNAREGGQQQQQQQLAPPVVDIVVSSPNQTQTADSDADANESFELVDSTGLESDLTMTTSASGTGGAGSGVKKRNKKGKKAP